MTDATSKVISAIERGLSKRGLPHERADVVYQVLLADGPMSVKEICEVTGLPQHMVYGSAQPLELLEADGRVTKKPGAGAIFGARWMYYAEERS